jgi:hypothetical protein
MTTFLPEGVRWMDAPLVPAVEALSTNFSRLSLLSSADTCGILRLVKREISATVISDLDSDESTLLR